jgi:hypothetical protein
MCDLHVMHKYCHHIVLLAGPDIGGMRRPAISSQWIITIVSHRQDDMPTMATTHATDSAHDLHKSRCIITLLTTMPTLTNHVDDNCDHDTVITDDDCNGMPATNMNMNTSASRKQTIQKPSLSQPHEPFEVRCRSCLNALASSPTADSSLQLSKNLQHILH